MDRCLRLASMVLVALLAASLRTPEARAAGNVSTCDASHLATALSGGGAVTFSCSGTITLASTLTISSDTTIDATGQSITLSGNNAVQILSIDLGVTLSLTNLTLANGKSDLGAGISNDGTLTVTNCTFSGNTVKFYGSGIYNSSTGTLTVADSTFSGNSGGYGVGIFNASGTTTVTRSVFSGNSANVAGGTAAGIYNYVGLLTVSDSTFSGNSAIAIGGIYNEVGTLTVTNSTFSGNTSGSGGGGIHNDQGTATVTNSTFSGNVTTDVNYGGGGIANSDGDLTITNSTFSGNSASHGGSVHNYFGTVTFKSSVLAGATSGGECAGDHPTFIDDGYNMADDGTCSFIAAGSANNVSGTSLNLGALASNGGPTKTIAPRAGSAVIDIIPNGTNGCGTTISTDQRGIPRPQNLNCDIGAFEFSPADVLPIKRRGQLTSQ